MERDRLTVPFTPNTATRAGGPGLVPGAPAGTAPTTGLRADGTFGDVTGPPSGAAGPGDLGGNYPDPTVDSLGNGLITSAAVAAQIPTVDQKAALAGTSGAPAAGNPYVTTQDPRVLPYASSRDTPAAIPIPDAGPPVLLLAAPPVATGGAGSVEVLFSATFANADGAARTLELRLFRNGAELDALDFASHLLDPGDDGEAITWHWTDLAPGAGPNTYDVRGFASGANVTRTASNGRITAKAG